MKVQGLVRVYSCCIFVNEHMCQQVKVLHAVDGSHAPSVLTILHAASQRWMSWMEKLQDWVPSEG